MEKVITVKTFLEMFVAISYLQEQRMFSYNKLKKYFKDCYDPYDDSADFIYDDVKHELNTVLDDMYDEEIIDYLDTKLCFITDKINYKEIIENNRDILPDMIEAFKYIHGGNPKKLYIVPSKSIHKK